MTNTATRTTDAQAWMTPPAREVLRLLREKRDAGWDELVQTYGMTFTYQRMLATCEPELVHQILLHRPHTVERSKIYKLFGLLPGAAGLVFTDGEAWRRRLGAIQPILQPQKLAGQAPVIHRLATRYADELEARGAFTDLYRVCNDLGVRIFMEIGCGLDTQSPRALAMGRELIEFKTRTMRTRFRTDEFGFSPVHLLRLPIVYGLMARSRARVHRSVQEIIARPGEIDHGRPNWFDRLKDAGFGPSEIADDINSLFGAFDTTDFFMTCALFELGRRPEWRERLRAELRSVRKEGSSVGPTDLAALPDTMGFMKEVLRLYPALMVVLRRTGEPMEVRGRVFPAGTEVVLMIRALHTHPDLWDAPLAFDPERWRRPPCPRVEFSYVPFLEGPRQCYGRHLAELYWAGIIAVYLERFDITVNDRDVRMNPYMIARFDRPIPGSVRPLRAAAC
jgi:cytochrome P450